MKIEKISENQIRCTLTSADLSSRQIRLSELAYGSDKARQLFQDMMQEAEYSVGFSSGNSPLMIEAIPTSPDSIVLIITKVDDPEELDTRFSHFTQSDEEPAQQNTPSFFGADEVLDLFHKIYETRKAETSSDTKKKKEPVPPVRPAATPEKGHVNLVQSFWFTDLDSLILAAHTLAPIYNGSNTVYTLQAPDTGYQLILHQSDCSPELFNMVCNNLSEFGKSEPVTPAKEAWFHEHGQVLIKNTALQTLAELPV